MTWPHAKYHTATGLHKSMAHWPYNTPQWVRLRKVKLQQQPLCEVCMKRGRIVRANTVDHIISIKSGGHPFPTLDELMSMCTPCHNSKSRNTDQPTGKGIAYKGCDASGLPIDPSHPFYGSKPITPSKDGQAKAYDRHVPRKITKLHNDTGG
jgi:5-methylcytosine-specific restriction enzyme A